ncbi:MAG: hypothetical protein WDN06_11465 [Asticcacaulis sp.]
MVVPGVTGLRHRPTARSPPSPAAPTPGRSITASYNTPGMAVFPVEAARHPHHRPDGGA